MVDISKLPQCLKNPDSTNIRETPHLKYVVEMSETLCPNAGFLNYGSFFMQGGTCIFLKRYFDGKIDTSFMPAYQNNMELQNTLEVYGIDPTAFWYLILFLKDYVDDESIGEKIMPNTYTEIYNFASTLNEMNFCESPIDGEYLGCKNGGILEYKVGKHRYKIDNDKALYSIFSALCSYLKKAQPKIRKELIDGVWEEVDCWDYDTEYEHLFKLSSKQNKKVISIPETYKISYFTKYMRKFLSSYNAPKHDRKISTDKWLLISRVIYVIGYSTDIRYNTRYNNSGAKVKDYDFLKNNYKKDKYKDAVRRKVYV